MPCVLPVIAVKVLSFVQQAGESRERILALNVSYALGVVSVFTILACLAVFVGIGWGEQFQSAEFNLIMAAFVFAMGLSLLGVFEIPVPGMIGSAAGGQHREGLPGAFMTGIFATLLATPCSGPFMGTTLAWSVQQPTEVTFLVWIVMGIGMASPYLVIGAFPKLVNWLPRPGMWMVRFKEFAGFVLMGAVIWIMNAINQEMLIPTLIVLVGVALGLWMIGNLYDHSAPPEKKWTIRGVAVILTAGICGYGWSLMYRGHELPWEEFSTARIEELRDEGKPVLIDFTADWCAICKTNEVRALNRPQTIEFVEDHGIVPVMADYTNENPEIRRWLELCNQEGVPLTLVFAKDRPDVAIPLRGMYSQAKLLETLEAAIEGNVNAPERSATQTAEVTTPEASRAGLIQ
jgi:thiol:disulfide interchange protein DsbD